NVDDAVVDAAPVQLVLGPAVADSRQRAKKILERKGRSGPVVRLELRQGDDDIGREDRSRQVERLQAGQSAKIWALDRFVMVNVREGHFVVSQDIAQAALLDQEFDIEAVSLTFGHNHLRRA